MSQQNDDHRPAGDPLDPLWETELRRGQAAAGARGSVDTELAMVRLLRHAAAPPVLPGTRIEEVLRAVEAEVLPAPWWKRLFARRRSWLLAGAATATAAVGLLWYAGGGAVQDVAPSPQAMQTEGRNLPAAGSRHRNQGAPREMAALLAQQFQRLAPLERTRMEHRLDAIRNDVVEDLLRALEEGAGRRRP